jgi:RND family efflux transporter MFP subunit
MKLKIGLLAAVAAATLLSGCKEEAQTITEMRPVRTVVAGKTALVEQRTAVGEIRPYQQNDLSFQVSGKVIERHVNIGDLVKPGDVIARLDPQDYAKRLSAADADVAAAEATFVEAQATEARQHQLFEKGVAAKAGYDTALRNRKSSEAALESAKIARAMAEDQLSYTLLTAETNGIVTAVGAEAEQFVNPGHVIVSIAPQGDVDAVFSVAEAALQEGFFTSGMDVTITLLSDPGKTARGKVREVSPMADPATRTFEVKVALNNPPPKVMFGSSVSGEAVLSKQTGVALPGSAIFDDKGKPAVWIVDRASEQVSLKKVQIAEFDADKAIISHGIDNGDVVVTAGANHLRQGEKVKLIKE